MIKVGKCSYRFTPSLMTLDYVVKPCAVGGLIWPIQNDAINLKIDNWNPGTWVPSESSQQELSNEYQHDRV